jgi:hypothetical protein
MKSDAKAAWRKRLIDAELQALEDVACASASTTTVIEAEAGASAAAQELAAAALDAGFAVASASLADHGLHGLDTLVRAFALDLRLPGRAKKGLVAGLEAFAAGRRAEERFEEAADQEGLFGELRSLAANTIGAASAQAANRRLQTWLRGDDPKRAADAETLRVLSPRTAKPALAALTRLARVLGAKGTLLLLVDGEALADLPMARRDIAYTVLRELIDNGDGGRGMTATKITIFASPSLFQGSTSVLSHGALLSRLGEDEASAPTPHAPRIALDPIEGKTLGRAPEVEAPEPRRAKALRSLLRVTQGLPPIDATMELTIGMEEIDSRVDKLFETASNDGSVFSILLGDYGAGKTHHLLHLEARALAERRPVFWLSIERLDEDLGNPQRHLRRLLEGATLPLTGAPSPLDRLEHWLRSEAGRKKLGLALSEVAASDGEAAPAARKALRNEDGGAIDEAAVKEVLGALDLVDKPSQPSYRRDAYARLQLWLELIARLEGCEGPVVLLDEAENLYRPGVSRAERRTALRSLGFYCGGGLPRACVVLAVTPSSLEELRAEAGELLDAIEEQRTLLATEDVTMLRRRLLRSKPLEVIKLTRADRETLGHHAKALYEKVHGKVKDAGWDAWLHATTGSAKSPRAVLQAAALRLERLAWGAS